MSLKNKKILITAGPTWVAIDKVRVISNLATGETGWILADKFKRLGARVTLLLGPGDFSGRLAGIRLVRFKYFSQLARLLEMELNKGYAGLVHAAAVADYQPKHIFSGKVSSKKKDWKLELVPTKKLIRKIKPAYPGLFTVGFKFEPEAAKSKLLKEGAALLSSAKLDLVVANSNKNNGYQAYILGERKVYGPYLSKNKMAAGLSGLMEN